MESTANIGSVAAGCSVGGFVAGMALLVLAMLGYKRFRDTKGKKNIREGKSKHFVSILQYLFSGILNATQAMTTLVTVKVKR